MFGFLHQQLSEMAEEAEAGSKARMAEADWKSPSTKRTYSQKQQSTP
jgi:hypothetical protein